MADGDQLLYLRCPACPADDPTPGCEACHGGGFIPTGLSMEMFEGMMDRLGELKELAESILGLANRGPGRARRNGA